MDHRRFRKGKLRLFVRKHSTLLTFLGAIVVFITFAVNEGLRESVREHADGLQRIGDAVSGWNETDTLLQELHAMEAGTVKEKKDKYILAIDAQVLRDNLALKFLEREKRLLPNGSSVAKDLGEYETYLAKVQKDCDNAAFHDFDVEKLRGEANFLASYRATIGAEILSKEESGKEEADSRYTGYTRLSYVLYAIGWGLGLVGKLFGVDSGSE
jgi:hypothetical protein